MKAWRQPVTIEPSQLRRWDLGISGEGGLPDAEMITLQVEEARGCWVCVGDTCMH
jgi:hypothetical protein